MAEVRRGTDTRLGRTVAVKRLRTDLAGDGTFHARFRREAQSSASLNHPAIVAVYDTGEELATDGSGVAQPYIVMEYVEGRTLRDVLREGRKILPERALEIAADVLSALEYSHRAGIIHRDIKPGNVMLTPAGEVKVMDFGIARAISDAASSMTQTAIAALTFDPSIRAAAPTPTPTTAMISAYSAAEAPGFVSDKGLEKGLHGYNSP